ncbi:MAG TPA: lytic transglycosylase domain-containing protein, partial [Firmicutes bacterium]|nr:lytic transglycosylase domain-containing protein [Bacillota bacterium]
EALLGMENKKLTPRGKLALIECCRLAPLSYYHIKAARLLHLSPLDSRLFSARIKRGRPNQKMKSLLNSLDAYSDIEGIRLIQLSIDNDCFHDNLPLFMNLYLRYRDFDWMILSTRYLWKTEGPSKDLLPYLYPRGFKKEIRLHSALPAEQDPLVYAVIHQESRFSPTAVSRAGARGLMQLMPSTFTDLIRTAAETGKEESIFDIDDNITAGTAYLKRLFHRFSQSEYVLAAYNAGPHRLHLWKDEFGHRSPDEFVELIPFAETRYYVSRVIALEEIYRAMGP